jgi:hypothetical protein
MTDGARHEGLWYQGKMNGRGIYYYPDGDRYEGKWKVNKRDGGGTQFYSDGRKEKYLYK